MYQFVTTVLCHILTEPESGDAVLLLEYVAARLNTLHIDAGQMYGVLGRWTHPFEKQTGIFH